MNQHKTQSQLKPSALSASSPFSFGVMVPIKMKITHFDYGELEPKVLACYVKKRKRSFLKSILSYFAAPVQRHFEELCVWHLRGITRGNTDVLKPWQIKIASRIEFFFRRFR